MRVLKNSGQPPPVVVFLPKLRKAAPICDFFNTLIFIEMQSN